MRAASSLLSDAIRFSAKIPLPQIPVVQFEATRMAHGPRMVDAPAEILKVMLKPESGYANRQFADCVMQHFGSGLLTLDEAPGQSSHVRSANDGVYHWKLMQPLLQAVEDASSLSLEPNQILIAYRCFKKAWSGQVSSEILIPLAGLEGALSSAVRFERLLLARFFVPEKNKFARRNHHPQYITLSGIGRSHFKLTSPLSSGDGEHSACDIQIEAQRIITAFRLALPGRLGARAIFVDAIARAFGGSFGNFAGFEVPEFVVDPIFFSDVDVPKIRKAFFDLRSARAFEPECEIWGSIGRFTDSYHHDTNGDRVLDYAGTLEGCLIRGMTEQKKAKLVAERASRLIAPEFDPENTKTILRKFFTLRNNRAHENWAIADRPLVDKVNGIVRAVLRRFIVRLAAGESKEHIIASSI
jgi:hypothetical protein